MASRVRQAGTTGDLIELIWDIQDHFATQKRDPRRAMSSLQRARELLGLGNTVVSDDSRPPHLDEDF
jgi:hypothetical protein